MEHSGRWRLRFVDGTEIDWSDPPPAGWLRHEARGRVHFVHNGTRYLVLAESSSPTSDGAIPAFLLSQGAPAGTMPDPTRPLVAGYTVNEHIGEGSEAAVWRATADDGRVVAIKQHHTVALWRMEAEALRSVDSPRIVRWVADFESGLVIVRELIDGLAPAKALLEGYVNPRAGLRESLLALADLDAVGRTTQDLRLDNLIVEASGRVVLIDAGTMRSGRLSEWLTREWIRALALRWRGYKIDREEQRRVLRDEFGASGNVHTGAHIYAANTSINTKALRALDAGLSSVLDEFDPKADPLERVLRELDG